MGYSGTAETRVSCTFVTGKPHSGGPIVYMTQSARINPGFEQGLSWNLIGEHPDADPEALQISCLLPPGVSLKSFLLWT